MEEKSDNNYEISLYNVESIKEFKKTFVNLNKKKIKCNKIIIIILSTFLVGLLLLLFSKQFIKIFLNTKIDNQNITRTKDNKKKPQECQNTIKLQNNNNFRGSNKNLTQDKWKKEILVMHALGEFNNTIYSNAYESLNYYYEVKKMKLMEADFRLTNDDHIIIAHDYEIFNKSAPSLEEYKKSRTRGNLTPMIFEDLVKYMYNHEDLYIITDSKYTDFTSIKKEFNEMTEILSRYGNVNERFIIQTYNERMYEFLEVKNIHLIIIYLLYIKE